nr:plasmid mobilization relaxosome protein MobC [Ruminococcus sp.]
MKRIGANINQILVRLHSTGRIYAEDIDELKRGVTEIWHTLLSIRSGQIGMVAEPFQEEK